MILLWKSPIQNYISKALKNLFSIKILNQICYTMFKPKEVSISGIYTVYFINTKSQGYEIGRDTSLP